jgi:hypothetical protein
VYFQYFDCSIIKIATFLLRYIFLKSINIGPLISHCFRITNQRSIFFLKTSIYIQIVIRWASIHRLSICIIVLPTTDKKTFLYQPIPYHIKHCNTTKRDFYQQITYEGLYCRRKKDRQPLRF